MRKYAIIFLVMALLTFPKIAIGLTIFNDNDPAPPEVVELEPGVGVLVITPKVVECKKVKYNSNTGLPVKAKHCTIVFGTINPEEPELFVLP